MRHLTDEEILDLIDGEALVSGNPDPEDHIKECRRCRDRQASLLQLDRTLAGIPAEKIGKELTRSVLRRIGVTEKDPLLYRLLEKSAHFFALALVLTILVGIFAAFGVVGTAPEGGGSLIQRFVGIDMISTLGSIGRLFQTYLPIRGEAGTAVAILLVVSGLGLVDRVIGRKVLS